MTELMNEFDGPIPMASLTEELGSRAYEKPPQYTDPADAFDMIVDGMATEKARELITFALQLFFPSYLFLHSVIFIFWATGKYSFDTMLLISGPVFEVMTHLLDKAGVNYDKFAEREEDNDIEEAIELLKKLDSGDVKEKDTEEDTEEEADMMPEESTEPEVPRGGLMGGVA